jgi:O-antigen ligase
MQRQKRHFYISYFLLLLAVTTMPFTRYLMLPIELALLLNWLVEWRWKEKWQNLKNNGLHGFLWLFLGLYLLTIIGLAYTTKANLHHAMANLDCKSWLWVATLLFFTSDAKLLTNKRIALLLLVFTASTVLVMCGCLVWSAMEWRHDGQLLHFFYGKLSHFDTHTSYLAMYVTFSIIIAACSLLFKLALFQEINPVLRRIICYPALLIGPPSLFLLQSKAGMLIGLLVLILLFVLWLNWRKKRYLLTVSLVIILLSSIVLLFSHIQLPARFQTAWMAISQPDNQRNADDGTLLRMAVWQSSWQEAMTNMPFGVGSGDVKQSLSDSYDRQSMDFIRERLQKLQLNAHNQYLQTLVALGIPGLLALVLWLLLPFGMAIKRRAPLYALFLLVVSLNMLVESMLETRAGVDFIAIMHPLLFLILMRAKTIKSIS